MTRQVTFLYKNNSQKNMRYCDITNCDNKHLAKGLCIKHYSKEQRKKDPERSKEYDGRWRKSNPKTYLKKNKEKQTRWRNRNIEKSRAKVRKYNRENSEKVLKLQLRRLEKLGKIFSMTSNEYKYAQRKWSAVIKNLDNHICKSCDSMEKLNAHHIIPQKDFPKLAFNLNNGITLCKKCHNKIHGITIKVIYK